MGGNLPLIFTHSIIRCTLFFKISRTPRVHRSGFATER